MGEWILRTHHLVSRARGEEYVGQLNVPVAGNSQSQAPDVKRATNKNADRS